MEIIFSKRATMFERTIFEQINLLCFKRKKVIKMSHLWNLPRKLQLYFQMIAFH